MMSELSWFSTRTTHCTWATKYLVVRSVFLGVLICGLLFARSSLAQKQTNRTEQSQQYLTEKENRTETVRFEIHDGQMEIRVDGQPFATYVWNDPQTTRPYFKQVRALGGKIQVTRSHPPQADDFTDHETFHPGIWWGFGDVGGNDYWRLKAKVSGGDFVSPPTSEGETGTFTVRNRLLVNGGQEEFCQQVCRYSIVKTGDGILLICDMSLSRMDGDFWLGDQEEMGLAVRVAKPICVKTGQGGRIINRHGQTDLKQIRTTPSDWCDYCGPINEKFAGVMIMNDPANFRKPWWHAVDTGLLVANPLGESELHGKGKKRQNVRVRKGEEFRLRYGVLIHLHDAEDDFDRESSYADFCQHLEKWPRQLPAATN